MIDNVKIPKFKLLIRDSLAFIQIFNSPSMHLGSFKRAFTIGEQFRTSKTSLALGLSFGSCRHQEMRSLTSCGHSSGTLQGIADSGSAQGFDAQ